MYKIFFLSFFLMGCVFLTPAWAEADTNTQKRIVALGDSLTAGYGLSSGQDYPNRLQEALNTRGHNVTVENAGVAGDTSAGGRARLEWAIDGDPAPDLVIVALGANDMLRGLTPNQTFENIDHILRSLQQRGIPTLLAGMKSPLNMGEDYREIFDAIYPELAAKYDIAFYPFFLDGVAMEAGLNLPDGMHPNEKGVGVIVEKITPVVGEILTQQ